MSEVIVLDTHVWFWLMTRELDRFPEAWQAEIDQADVVGVAAVSCYEIALAHQRGRLELPYAASEWFAEALEPAGIGLLPLTAEIAVRAVNLSPVHQDPFDRMIIATALSYGCQLASVDGIFARYEELEGCSMT